MSRTPLSDTEESPVENPAPKATPKRSKNGRTGEGESKKAKRPASQVLPVIPLKELVVFPRMILPLFIARVPSLRALDEAMAAETPIALLAQPDDQHAYPGSQELPRIGVIAQILQTLRQPDGSTRVMVECRSRIRWTRWVQDEPCLKARFVELVEPDVTVTPEQEVLVQLMMRQFETFMQQSQQGAPEMVEHIPTLSDPGALADMIAAYLPCSQPEKQAILEILDPIQRLEASGRLLSKAAELQAIENQIHGKIRQTIDQHQKEFFLREKLRAIREELGDESSSESEGYRGRIEALPAGEVRDKAKRELQRLEKTQPLSSEGGVIRTWLDTLLELPWEPEQAPTVPLSKAAKRMEQEHFGLDKAKDRILEYLAVQQLTGKPPQTVLCLVGPPGVGKTSLARAIAEATGRKFERIALGGVGDDAEIRGHRRTYIGALPGRLIQALQRSGTTHTVILLDELDKLTRRYSGDPAAALLEVLDPEQNNAFRDHYLELPFDLSQVLFVCAANVLDTLPRPLRDRLQVVQLSGYTEAEKIQIAKRHLMPRQLKRSGIDAKSVSVTQHALEILIRRYTRESGVRELERQLGQLYRWLARQQVQAQKLPKRLHTLPQLSAILGPPRFSLDDNESQDSVGLVHGLAWTETGGSVLPIEVALSPGKGKLLTTGNLGEVMKESMQLALACVRQRSLALGIDPERFQHQDVHIHVPEGAIPKDGPSAGIAIASALASAFSGRAARASVAMTGEITLRGRVLPIGGLKEKLLAAYREGRKTVLLPAGNAADLAEIPAEIRAQLRTVTVQHLDEVLAEILLPAPDAP